MHCSHQIEPSVKSSCSISPLYNTRCIFSRGEWAVCAKTGETSEKNWKNLWKSTAIKYTPLQTAPGGRQRGVFLCGEKAGLPRYSGTVEVRVALEAVKAVQHQDLVIIVIREQLI